jgi:hypothetical protein
MRDIDLNKPPEEQSQPSSPEQRANILPPKKRRLMSFQGDSHGESSTSRAVQRPIGDFTRHLAHHPYYPAQGEVSRQQETASHVIRPEAQRPQEATSIVGNTSSGAFRTWKAPQSREVQLTVESTASKPIMGNTSSGAFRTWKAPQSREAQHYPEQPLPNEASSSYQQPQGDLHPHARIDNIQQALQFSMNELERLRSSIPYTEHMAPQPEEMFLSNDGVATSVSDSQSEPSLSSSHKRKRDEASSSTMQPEKEKKLIRSQNQKNAKISEIRKKRREGKELTEDEQKLIRSHDKANAKASEIRKKRREGKELTEDEQKLIRSYDKVNARHNAKASEIRKKRREGKELTEDEQKLIRSHDKANARHNAKASEIRKKQREAAISKSCIS